MAAAHESFDVLYKRKFDERWQKNTNDVIQDARSNVVSPRLRSRVEFECNKRGLPFDGVLDLIKSNRFFASFFALDPSKQSLAEHIQLYIVKTRISPSVERLPARGRRAVYIQGGVLKTNQAVKPAGICTKSFDFYDRVHDMYYVAKHTTETGGLQDYSYNELVLYIDEFKQYLSRDRLSTNIAFTIVLSGSYYTVAKTQFLSDKIPLDCIHRIKIYKNETFI